MEILIMRSLKLSLFAALFLNSYLSSAHADMKVCNDTKHKISIAFAHKKNDVWMSEGWWTAKAKACISVFEGDLADNAYYVGGIDLVSANRWSGSEVFCTDDRTFTITERKDCESHGLYSFGFVKIETSGEKNWTVSISPESADWHSTH